MLRHHRYVGAFRHAAAGAVTALAAMVGALAVGGFLGPDLASQTLLANMSMHSAVAAAALSMALMLIGWHILGAAGFVASLGLVGVGIVDIDWRPVDSVQTPSVRFDIVQFNVLFSNPNGAAIAAWLEAERPDVAILMEAEPLNRYLHQLAPTFPYRMGCTEGMCDLLVLSRHTLQDGTVADLPGAPGRLATGRITKEGVTLTIGATHWSKSFFSELRSQQATATRRAVRSARRSGPVVVAGDFNATHWEPEMKRFSDWLGLGHPARWVPTWPRRLGPLGVQIDHVLVSHDVAVEHVGTIPARLGSNHRGLRIGVAIATGRDSPASGMAHGGSVQLAIDPLHLK